MPTFINSSKASTNLSSKFKSFALFSPKSCGRAYSAVSLLCAGPHHPQANQGLNRESTQFQPWSWWGPHLRNLRNQTCPEAWKTRPAAYTCAWSFQPQHYSPGTHSYTCVYTHTQPLGHLPHISDTAGVKLSSCPHLQTQGAWGVQVNNLGVVSDYWCPRPRPCKSSEPRLPDTQAHATAEPSAVTSPDGTACLHLLASQTPTRGPDSGSASMVFSNVAWVPSVISLLKVSQTSHFKHAQAFLITLPLSVFWLLLRALPSRLCRCTFPPQHQWLIFLHGTFFIQKASCKHSHLLPIIKERVLSLEWRLERFPVCLFTPQMPSTARAGPG